MKVKDLQKYLSNFEPNASVVIWEWNGPNSGDNTCYCEVACNYDHQQELQTVMLMRGLPTSD